jgi:RNA polymerase sigma-54 factor
MAPQMRQSLEFLQVPMLELRALIRKEIEQNPTLEEKADDHTPLEIEPGEGGAADAAEAASEEEYRKLAAIDASWREYFRTAGASRGPSAEEEERRQHFLDSLTREVSLQEHLIQQLDLTDLADADRQVAVMLIGSLNDDGYLNITLGELSETTGLPVDALERVLRAVQDLDPPGVASRDLPECLRIQLARSGRGDGIETRIVDHHLADLAAMKHADIARALGVPVADIHHAARLIGTLEPRPGRAFGGDAPAYVLPDVTVAKSGDEYTVTLNNERLPRVRISKHYRQLMEDPATPKETRAYIRDKIRAGAFLLRSIHQRQETIANIAREIVRVQRDFLEHGVSHLRPLVMAEIAKVLGVHETTVSRAVSGKYMQTPRGLFEMKFFFTPGYQAADGQMLSNKAIKDAIEEIVAAEDVAKPLADDAIARTLGGRGIKVARRTIAKYREELKIPPSHLRKG